MLVLKASRERAVGGACGGTVLPPGQAVPLPWFNAWSSRPWAALPLNNPLALLLLRCLQMPRGLSVLSSRPSAKPGKASISLFCSTEPVHVAYHRLKDSLKNGHQVRQSKYLPVLSFENGLPLCLVRCLWGPGLSLEDFSHVDQVKLLSQFKMQWISLLAAAAHVRSRYYSTTQPVKH